MQTSSKCSAQLNMIIGFNCNGTCTRFLNESSPSLLKALLNPIVLEESVRFEKEAFLFWEKHYFRMIAALRRMRFQIPNSYTPKKFILESKKLIDYLGVSKEKALLFHFHFVCEESNNTSFIIECEPLNFLESNSSFFIVAPAPLDVAYLIICKINLFIIYHP
mgnify:CR=1 FL=1